MVAVCIAAPVFLWGWGNDLSQANRSEIAAMKQKLRLQQERIDGLVSVIEGLNETIGELRRNNAHQDDSDILKRRMAILEERIEKLERQCERNAAEKKSFQPADEKKKTPKLSSSKRYAKAVHAYKKRAYDTARRLFETLHDEGYKPAACDFYLGEISYYTKQYDDAIFYYKRSASLNDKAGYMDVLLLHTAIALDKTGKKEQAQAFYRTVIEQYPHRKSAKIAAKRLGRL
jgi:TolA-binding protein